MKISGGNWKKISKYLLAVILMITAIFGFANSKSIMSNVKQFFAAGDVPAHTKKIKENGDGTYKLSLDVTGDAEKKAQKANVIIVFDTSSSMNKDSGTDEVTYTRSNDNGDPRYGKEGDNNYFRLYRHRYLYTPYNGTPTSGTYYGWYNNQFVELYYNNGTWYRTRSYSWGSWNYSNPYNGTFYTRGNDNAYRYYKSDGTNYTGDRYIRTEANQSRLEAAQSATNELANALLSNNGKDGNADDTIEIALVDFANHAVIAQEPTTKYEDFENAVNDLDAGNNNRGTNWEAALQKVSDVDFEDEDQTFVIFVSDGNPTFRNTKGNYDPLDDYYYNGRTVNGVTISGVYGNGSDSNTVDGISASTVITRCYDHALDDAQAIVTSGKQFYTIFAYGDTSGATNMRNITTGAGAPASNNYSAENTAALQSAFAEILAKIEMSGINNVKIEDETTENVKIESTDTNGMLVVDNTSFTYTVTIPITEGKATIRGQEATLTGNTLKWGDKEVTGTIDSDGNFVYDWTGANDLTDIAPPEAKDNNGNVVWDLTAAGVLINGATYRVSFDVWPSQETYDLIADLKNGTKKYETLPPQVKEYLSPSYVLETNKGATLYYNDTRNDDGDKSSTYNNPPDVGTSSETIDVEKKWETAYDGRQPAPVTVTLNRDEETFLTVDLDGNVTVDDKWETAPWTATKINIATGLARIKDGKLEILDEGHDYTFGELGSVSYNWELTSDIVHPMLINNEKYKLVLTETYPDLGDKDYILDGAGEPTYIKLSNGNVYKVSKTNPTIEATNHRRSNLNIKKVVDGVESDPNRDFEFTVKVTQKDENGEKIESVDTQYYNDYLWFSVQDEQGNWIDYGNTLGDWARSEGTDRETGKPTYYYYAPNGTELVINLKHGYNIRFTNLISNTDFDVKEGSIDNYKLDSITSNDDNTATDKIDLDSKTIKGKISNTNKTYQVTYTNEYQKVDIPVEKIWTNDDNGSEGLRKAIEVKLYANDEEVDSATIGLDDNKNPLPGTTVEGNTWKYTFEDKDRFANEEEITYTISETVTPSLEPHYESTVNGYKITNTRNPDDIKTSVSGKKTWDDSNNQDGLRPDSIEIKLIANGDKTNPVATKTVTADDEWKYAFDNIPKYKDGQEIKYTIIETPVTDYNDPEYDDSELNVTNTHSPFETQVKVTKTWNDANNQDGIRPESISVSLLVVDKDGNKIPYSKEGLTNPVTLNEDNNWTATWTGLPRRAGGQDIKYEVSELDLPTGYESNQNEIEPTQETTSYSNEEKTYVSSETYALINTHEPETVTIPVKKIWNDNDDQDAIRDKEEITFNLYGVDKNTPINSYTFETNNCPNNECTYTFTEDSKGAALPKYEAGKVGSEINYTIEETGTSNKYTPSAVENVNGTLVITNTHVPEETEATVTKVWDDNDDQDAIRPELITMQLLADGKEVKGKTVELTDDKLTEKITGLPKYNKSTTPIKYTWEEVDVPTGYEITSKVTNGTVTTITNTHIPEVTEATVTKVWDDNGNQDAIRPESITMQLLADGEVVAGKTVELTDAKLTATITGLPKYNHSKTPIKYTWSESELPEGYKMTSNVTDGTRTTITNQHVPEVTEATVTKVWDDNDNQDAIRPESITMQLLADGEVVAGKTVELTDKKLTATITGLPKYNHSKTPIEYTWEESELPEGYKMVSNDTEGTETTITNQHVPEVTEATVTKVWDDNGNQDAIRPESITMQLLADGEVVAGKTVELTDAKLTATITGLPKYNHSKTAIKYTWSESELPEGYKMTSNVTNGTETTITNQHVPEVTEATVTKVWDDNDNQDAIRPESITMQLLADGEVVAGKTVELTDKKLTATITGLPKYNHSKTAIEYTWEEVEVPTGYEISSTETDGTETTITNTHTPEVTEATVTKVWDDNNNQDGIRPESITMQLYADDELVKDKTVTLTDEQLTETITGLPKYNKSTTPIKYTWKESELPEGYKMTSNVTDGTRTTITNQHVTEETSISVTKVWDDADDQDGIRPQSVTVNLLADGEAVEGEDPVTLNSSNNWAKTWSGLDRYKEGKEIDYTVEELTTDVITGTDGVGTYKYEITGTMAAGFTITNTHTPETVTISGEKTWNDANNQDGLRPETITINLFADKKLVNSQEFPVDPKTGECNYSFTTDSNGVKLPKYTIDESGKGGKEIIYTITENRVSDYEEPEIDGLNVTNTHNPFETQISVEKIWNDANDIDGKRSKSITVTLQADGITKEVKTLDSSNEWKWTWPNLPRKAGGKDIEYTIKELVVPAGYESLPEGYEESTSEYTSKSTTTKDDTTYVNDEVYTMTNIHTPEKVKVFGEKVWDDADNVDGYRATTVKVTLLADGEETDKFKNISAQDEWKFEFPDLPKYEYDEDGNGGKEIIYSVKEEFSDPEGKYETEITGSVAKGFTITNTHKPEETSISGTKTWDDGGDQDGIRPTSITINVLDDEGTVVKSESVSGSKDSTTWNYTISGLPKYKVGAEGVKVNYSVDEVLPAGYKKSISGNNITNTYTPLTTTVKGTKVWDDANNQDGVRPASITVYVKDGDTTVDTITVTGDNTVESWNYESKELPRYRNHGKEEIKYTVVEETKGLTEIGYSVAIDGNTITNSRTPEVIEEFPITKSWIDNSNSEGFRPNSVDIQLLADDKPYGDPITIGTDRQGNPLDGTTINGNNWKYVFKNLPKYSKGTKIVYSIKEVNLDANYKAEQVDNRTIVNTIDAMKKDIPVKKVWDDASDQDGYRPDSIEFTLTGTVESEEKPVYVDKITLNGDTDTWESKFKDAPIFYKGTLITYTINEVVTKDLTDYYPETTSETVDGIYTITNKHTPEVTEITIGKTWDDKDDQDGKRPQSIEVTLTGNGISYGPVRIGLDENGNPLEGTTVDGNTWKYTFANLPKKANGEDINYVVSESNVDNYNQLSIINNVITNKHTPATISYEVVKEWKDYDNQDGKRPEFITVTLTGKVGDTVVYTSTITVKPDENGDWKYAFTGLDKYYKKQLIQYTLTEGNVDLYETDPIVDKPNEEGTVSISNKIINKHELETIDITVKKVWDDLDNKYNHRTTFVTVHLFADGEEVDKAMLTEANGWTTVFDELVKYREGKVGEEIEYTITEDAVEFYKTSIAESDNVFTITNTYDGPTDSEIVPPKTGILPTKDYTFFELLMNLILLSYSLVYLKKVEN